MTVFEAKGLRKEYGRGRRRVTALAGIDLRLESGRIYGLVGGNGAGKTTLLRLMAGLAFPTAGEMTLFGTSDPRGLAAGRQRMGCLIAGAAGYEDLSLRENLRAQALLLPDPGSADLRTLCELVGLDEGSRRRTLRQCSAGERQRYGLAAALLGDPELLLLDEPLNGLDPGGAWRRCGSCCSVSGGRGRPFSSPAISWRSCTRPPRTISSSASDRCWKPSPPLRWTRGWKPGD